jgi:hypothetical protein
MTFGTVNLFEPNFMKSDWLNVTGMIIAEPIRKSSKFRARERSIRPKEPGCQIRN